MYDAFANTILTSGVKFMWVLIGRGCNLHLVTGESYVCIIYGIGVRLILNL